MTLRHTTEFPERFLNAGTQRFERFGETQGHRFDVAVRQHAMKERVIESVSGDLHAKLVANGEVTGCQSPGVVILTEDDSFPRSVKTPPFRYSTFECPPRGIRKLTFVSLLKPFKQSLRLESRFGFQSLLNFGPNVFKRIGPRPIVAI